MGTLKYVKCTNLARGKMKPSETYYLRVYQGQCEIVESTRGPSKKSSMIHNQQKRSTINFISHELNRGKHTKSQPVNKLTHREVVAAKLQKIKAKKFPLSASKKLGALPSL